MWRRFGDDFINGYALKENLWLYARPMYGAQRSFLFYPKVMAIGLLPWTPLLAGRLIDGFRGRGITTAERLLWAWAVAVIGFFTFSQFKLDHYVFPAAPALCLLCGYAWEEARRTERPALGTIGAIITIPLLLVTAGAVLIPGLDRVPLDLPRTSRLLPIALIAASALPWLHRLPTGGAPQRSRSPLSLDSWRRTLSSSPSACRRSSR
jgi:4-amino-4-deoxy-L-arabinose transferase-like glycosyltransferase